MALLSQLLLSSIPRARSGIGIQRSKRERGEDSRLTGFPEDPDSDRGNAELVLDVLDSLLVVDDERDLTRERVSGREGTFGISSRRVDSNRQTSVGERMRRGSRGRCPGHGEEERG